MILLWLKVYMNKKYLITSGCSFTESIRPNQEKSWADYLAEKLGAQIIPEMDVYDIAPKEDGYVVKAKKSTGLLHPRTAFRCKKVIVSGGVMGSVKLLMECKRKGSLPSLSDELGNFVRSNSEAILGVKIPKADSEMTNGVAISAGFHPDKNTHIETFRFGKVV